MVHSVRYAPAPEQRVLPAGSSDTAPCHLRDYRTQRRKRSTVTAAGDGWNACATSIGVKFNAPSSIAGPDAADLSVRPV